MDVKRALIVAYALYILGFSEIIFAATDNVKFEFFGIDNGLSQQFIQTLYQDSHGFLWVGTQEGLNRFDGFNFKQYLHQPGIADSLSDKWVRAISEDSHGNLWVGTTAGINILDSKTDKFLRISDSSEQNFEFLGKGVYDIWRDKFDVMWVLTDKGINKYNEETNTFTQIELRVDGDSVNARSVFYDIDYGTWFASTDSTLHFLANGSTKIENIRFSLKEKFTSSGSILNTSISHVFIDSRRRIWIATDEHGMFINNDALRTLPNVPDNITFTHFAPEINGQISRIEEDSDGTIWFASAADGLFYLTQSGIIGHLHHDSIQQKAISSDVVNDILEDASGVLWVATFNGLNKWNTAHKRFDTMTVSDDNDTSLIGPHITAIDSIRDKIYVATTDGLSIVDRNSGIAQGFNVENSGLLESQIMALEVVSDKEVWLGYRSKGTSVLNPNDGTIRHYPSQVDAPGSLQSGAVTSLVQVKNGDLWLGTYGGGIHKFDRTNGRFKQYTSDQYNEYSLSSNRITSITEDHTGLLWIGTFDRGVNVLNPMTDSISRVLGFDEDARSLKTVWVTHQDNLGNIWFGTEGDGLQYIRIKDYENGVFKLNSITAADGLPSNVVYGILEDSKGSLWISTNRGLAKLDIISKEMATFTEAHGLLNREFNSGAFHKSQDGKFHFGGPSGVTSFYSDNIKPSDFSAPIEITSVQIQNNFHTLASLQDENGVIEFTHKDYLVGFEFASLDFVSPRKNRYKYKLEGFDKDWVHAIDTRRATYTNLPSGNYQFTVMGTNSDGIWNDLGKTISIVVKAPPWRTMWAYFFYSVSLGGIAIFTVIYITKKSEAQRKHREKLEEKVKHQKLELQQTIGKVSNASKTDQLTGLKSRHYLIDNMPDLLKGLKQSLEQAAATGALTNTNSPRLFFIVFDIDEFTPINSNYGYKAGDRVIIKVAEILEELLDRFDIFARWEGDGFLIVGERNDIEDSKMLVEKIRATIAEHLFDIGLSKPVRVSVSIGLCLFPFCIQSARVLSWQQVLRLAEKSMRESKKAGRNTWTSIVRTNKPLDPMALSVIADNLNKAIDTGHIVVARHEPQIFRSASIEV